jgi:hypothetical protein
MANIFQIHFGKVLEVSVDVICPFSKRKNAIGDHLKMLAYKIVSLRM